MRKQSLNLTVDPESVERGHRYSQRHGLSISKLVDDFLANLPMDEESFDAITPDVRSLIGIGTGSRDWEGYRKHLLEKYGQ